MEDQRDGHRRWNPSDGGRSDSQSVSGPGRARTRTRSSPGPAHATPEWAPVRRPGARRQRRADASRWHWLLLLPIVAPLLTPLYNRIEPQLFGLPFFYWCQLAFAGFATVVLTVVQLARKGP